MKFKQIGVGHKRKTKQGKSAIQLELTSKLVKRITEQDFSKIWLFEDGNGYVVFAPVDKVDTVISKAELIEKISEKKKEELERFEQYRKNNQKSMAGTVSGKIQGYDELLSEYGVVKEIYSDDLPF